MNINLRERKKENKHITDRCSCRVMHPAQCADVTAQLQ